MKIKFIYKLFVFLFLIKIVCSSSPSEPDPDGPCVQLTEELCLDRSDCKLVQGETCCGELKNVCAEAEADCESSGVFGCFEVLGVKITLPFCDPPMFDLYDSNPQCILEDGTDLCPDKNTTYCAQSIDDYCDTNVYTSCCEKSVHCALLPDIPFPPPEEETEPPFVPEPPSSTPCEDKTSINDCLSDSLCEALTISGCCGSRVTVCKSKTNICTFDSNRCCYSDFNNDYFFIYPDCIIPIPSLHEYDVIDIGQCYDPQLCPNSTQCRYISLDVCNDHPCCYKSGRCLTDEVKPTEPTPPPIFTTIQETLPPTTTTNGQTTMGGETISASTVASTVATTTATTTASTISPSSTIAELTTASTIREITTAGGETTIASTIASTTATTLASTSTTSISTSTISDNCIDSKKCPLKCLSDSCPKGYECIQLKTGYSCVPCYFTDNCDISGNLLKLYY